MIGFADCVAVGTVSTITLKELVAKQKGKILKNLLKNMKKEY